MKQNEQPLNVQKLIDEYATWLKNEITFEKVGECYEITTPCLDNANDYIQIYVKRDGDDLYLTDDGATIKGLETSGSQFTANRKMCLQRILNQYGITMEGNELIAKAPINGFAQKMHMFIQAILRIDDMFVDSKSKAVSFALDESKTTGEADPDAAVNHLLNQGVVVLPVRVGDKVYTREWVPCRYGQIPQSIGCAEHMSPDCETCCDAYDRVVAVTVSDVAFVAENFMSRRDTYQYHLTKEEA